MKTLFALALLLIAHPLRADEFSRWTWRNPSPLGTTLYSVVYAEGKFVAAGAAGNIASSPDGKVWAVENSGVAKRFLGVTHGDGTFVAYGFEAALVSSPDGQHWTAPAHNLPYGIKGMAYGAGVWAALDEYGNISSSPDLVEWNGRLSSVLSAFGDVIFAQEKFVAVGNRGVIMTSTNGIAWEQQDSGTTATFNDLAYGDGKFVAVGSSDESGTQGIILTSSNAEDWLIQFVDFPLYGVAYGPAGFTVVGGGFGGCGDSLISLGGLYFTPGPAGCDSGLDETPFDVACNGEACVAVGNDGSISVSEDGLIWESQQRGTTVTLNGAAATSNLLVIAGGDNTVLTSTNGLDYVEKVVPGGWLGAGSDGTGFVLVGGDGEIAESADGQQWQFPASPVGTGLYRVVHGPAGWLAGGTGSSGVTIVRQADGTWELGHSFGKYLSQLHYSPRLGVYFAIGSQGLLAVSSDRVDWTFRAVGTSKYLSGIAESPDRLLIVAEDQVFTSTNGVAWAGNPIGSDFKNWNGAYYANGLFMIFGRLQQNLLTSVDGVVWVNRSIGADAIFGHIFYRGSLYLTGRGGMILQSASASVPEFLSMTPGTGSGLDFELFGEIGRDYELQSSTNLLDWDHEQDYTQSARQHPLTLPTGPDQRFFRAKLKEP